AQAKFLVIADFAAIAAQRGHALAHGAAQVDGVLHAGEEVIVVVFHLGAQKGVADADAPIGYVEVGGGALHIGAQNAAGDAQHLQRVGVDVGGDHIAHGHIALHAAKFVGQRAGGNFRPGGPELHGIDEVGEQ